MLSFLLYILALVFVVLPIREIGTINKQARQANNSTADREQVKQNSPSVKRLVIYLIAVVILLVVGTIVF